MSLYSDQFLADEDPQALRQIVLDQGRDIESLKQSVIELEQVSNIAKSGGELESMSLPTLVADADGMHTDADLVDIDWMLPLNLADDDVTDVRCKAYDGTEWVYVGGLFDRIGGIDASNIARYSLITRQWEEVNGGLNSYVSSIALRPSDGVLFVGGNFTDAGGSATADYLAYDNGGVWGVVVASLSNTVHKLYFDTNDDLYVGGDYTNAGGNANADCVFMWDGSLHALGTGVASGGVRAIGIDASGNIWVGGGMTNRIRKWDGATWTQPFTISAGNVYSIQFNSVGVMFAGGSFTAVDGNSALGYLFSYDGTSTAAVGDTLNGTVWDIQLDDDDMVYVAGGFTAAGSLDLERVAWWDGFAWYPLSNGGGVSGLDGNVYSLLLLDNGSIILGGSFNFAGAIQCQSIALFCKPLSEAIDVIASLFELYANRTGITHDSATITDLTATNATITDGTITNATITALIASTLNGKKIWKSVYKTADESRTANTTLTNDSDLIVTPLTAGKKYSIRARIFFDTASTPDFKFRLGGSATFTNVRVFIKYVVPGTTTLVPAIETAIPFATTYAPVGTGSTGGYIEIDGEFEVTVTGTLAFQWAQNTSSASATKTLSGSYIESLELN